MILDPIRSILHFPFYRDVPKKSNLATVGYIAYLGLIYALAVVLALFIHIRPKIQETVDWLSDSVPKLTLADGKLTSAVQGPTILRHPSAEGLVVVIDTERTSAVTPAEMNEKGAVAYLTRNSAFLLNTMTGEMKVHDLSKAQNEKPVNIDAKFFRTLGDVTNTILYPIAFVATWFVFLAWKHLAALIYSLIGLLINAFMSGGLEYSALYKMAVYAQTPVIAIQIIALMLAKPIPLFRLLAFIIVGVYLWQGIRHLQNPPETPAAL